MSLRRDEGPAPDSHHSSRYRAAPFRHSSHRALTARRPIALLPLAIILGLIAGLVLSVLTGIILTLAPLAEPSPHGDGPLSSRLPDR